MCVHTCRLIVACTARCVAVLIVTDDKDVGAISVGPFLTLFLYERQDHLLPDVDRHDLHTKINISNTANILGPSKSPSPSRLASVKWRGMAQTIHVSVRRAHACTYR
jgi:hypothetical protein